MSSTPDPSFSVIKPGSKEWKNALEDAKALEDASLYEGAKGVAVVPDVLELQSSGGRRYQAHIGTQALGDQSKVFIHFKQIVSADLEELSAYLYDLVARKLNIQGTQAEAGVSPLFRNQYDFVLLGVPRLREKETLRRIAKALLDTFGC